MLLYPNINPVAFSLGPLTVHWYGIMYLLAFLSAWWIANKRCRRQGSRIVKQHIEDIIFYCALGVVLGGRCGYVFIYNFEQWLQDPLWLFRLWEGGMSFHGGLLGVILALALCARKHQHSFFELADFVAPMVPLGLGFGRIGNFIGGELWGRPTAVPWGMVFPHVDDLVRHPSQLYQAFLEGVLLFAIVFWFSVQPRPRMAVSAVFLLFYGIFRFLVEFVRQPDAHIPNLAFGWMTRGQLLSIPMIAMGLVLLVLAYRRASLHASPKASPEKNHRHNAHSSHRGAPQ